MTSEATGNEIETTIKELSNRDIEKLSEIRRYISEGVACTLEKQKCEKYLDSIIGPKCAVCRKPLTDPIYIIRDHKMHTACRKKYRG